MGNSEETKTEEQLHEENHREIATRLGSEFAKISRTFLPVMGEALGRTEKDITFGCTVTMRRGKDRLVICKIKANEPKIPTEPIEPVHFVCERSKIGEQMAFVWPGTLKSFRAELADRDVRPDQKPGDE